jgi:4-amino-4-deoxy-L-arabinose transferase-like glycosyltransferase
VPVLRRSHRILAAAVLGLALCNLTFRLDREIVTEWDESLYATNASEMVQSGDWIRTTFGGETDYYNAKPPLNVWLIAASFIAFGPNLITLRLASIAAAWLTVLLLQLWVRRCFGSTAGILASLVLATSFGFLYIHSGRSGNPDALLTLLILLVVITLWASSERSWRRVWLGPLCAAVFLLKGMAVLMPLALIAAVEVWQRRRRAAIGLKPLLVALLLFVVPVGGWVAMRWRVDEWRFFRRLVGYDFVARTVSVLEQHPGTWLYYVDVLLRDQYEWLIVGVTALCAMSVTRQRLRGWLLSWREATVLRSVVGSWAAITLLVPTLMQTKLPWYLNPFYPAFAAGVGVVLAVSFARASQSRRLVLVSIAAIALIAAESRLIWYSYHYRDLRTSPQGLVLAERDRLAGQRVFMDRCDRADMFVLGTIVGAQAQEAGSVDGFLRESRAGDYLVSSEVVSRSDLVLVRATHEHRLYRRATESLRSRD